MYRDITSLTTNPRTQIFCWSSVLRRPEEKKKNFPFTRRADQILTSHVSQKSKDIEGKLGRTQRKSQWKRNI